MFEKIKKILKKQKHKKIKIGIVIVIFSLFLIANNQNVKNVVCADNYSNYLENCELNVYSDRAMIFQESATSSNEYRNKFETNFLFPAKLSEGMFSAFSSDLTRYSLGQMYLNNLDNEMAFASNNNSETIYTNQNIKLRDSTVLNGTYKGIGISNNDYIMTPDSDITNDWGIYDLDYRINGGVEKTDYYNVLNDYPTDVKDVYPVYLNDFIFCNSSMDSEIEQIGFTDIVITDDWEISTITFEAYLFDKAFSNSYFTMSLFDGVSYFGNVNMITNRTSWDNFEWFSYTWNNLNLNQAQINNLEIRFTAPTIIEPVPSHNPPLWISNIPNSFSYIGVNSYANLYMSCMRLNVSTFRNVSIYNPDITGDFGVYSGEFSHTGETGQTEASINYIDSSASGSGCSVEVIAELDGHNEVIEMDDSGGGRCDIYDYFPSTKATGTMEYWFRKDTTAEYSEQNVYDATNSHSIDLYWHTSGNLKYNDGSTHTIFSYSADTWYYVRLEWDCSTDWHLWIDGVSIDGGSGYGYLGNPSLMDGFHTRTFNTPQQKNYYDSIDYSWSTDYFLNRILESSEAEFGIEYEFDIDYLGITSYKPIYLDLSFSYCANISSNIITYIYNYDIESWTYINSYNGIYIFNPMVFRLNETGQYRKNKLRFRIQSEVIAPSFRTYINDIYLNITYAKQNSNGYQLLEIKFNRYSDGIVLQGYFSFQVKLFDGYIYYRFLESNVVKDDYDIGWIFYNYSLYITDISEFEIIVHCRYGLNTLDMNIANFKAEMFFDTFQYDFIEQERKGSFIGRQYNLEVNFTSMNRNYLNLTGVYGNYSYNTLAGIRCLKGQNDLIYDRFFTIPFFNQKISVFIPDLDSDSYSIPDEPEAPKNQPYWTYESFRIIPSSTIPTGVGNWTVDFTQIAVEKYKVKYYYNPTLIDKKSFGDWSFKIGDWKISFNFLRDAIVWIFNVVLLFLQFLLYLVVASLSFVFMFLGCYIVMLLWNFAVYYLYIAVMWVLWFLVLVCYWIWELLLWIWRVLIYPLLQWCYNVLLPLIITAIIMIMAFMITVFIYVMTLGQVDFWNTYDMVEDILWLVLDIVLEWIYVFTGNMFHLLMFILWYFINMGLVYFRYLYSRARGNINRAEQLYYSFQIYIAPMVFIYNLIKRLLESTPEL